MQFNGDWRDLVAKHRVSLYKFINNEWRLYDFGTKSKIDAYLKKGYVVKPFKEGDKFGDITI